MQLGIGLRLGTGTGLGQWLGGSFGPAVAVTLGHSDMRQRSKTW